VRPSCRRSCLCSRWGAVALAARLAAVLSKLARPAPNLLTFRPWCRRASWSCSSTSARQRSLCSRYAVKFELQAESSPENVAVHHPPSNPRAQMAGLVCVAGLGGTWSGEDLEILRRIAFSDPAYLQHHFAPFLVDPIGSNWFGIPSTTTMVATKVRAGARVL
jgi:hypothetical protein